MENLLVQCSRSATAGCRILLRFAREPDWDALRERLERPFARAVAEALEELDQLLDAGHARRSHGPGALFLRTSAANGSSAGFSSLAGLPCQPLREPRCIGGGASGLSLPGGIAADRQRHVCAQIDSSDLGFPGVAREKSRESSSLIEHGSKRSRALKRSCTPCASCRRRATPKRIGRSYAPVSRCCAMRPLSCRWSLPRPAWWTFTEVAQMAQRVLKGEDELPSDAAIAVADGIHHLLVDEFQDTSRRQHKLISSLVPRGPRLEGRTVFVVGDPMQSIYFFRDADAELFPRVRHVGLELPDGRFAQARLRSPVVELPHHAEACRANSTRHSAQIFAVSDGSGIELSAAQPARETASDRESPLSVAPRFHAADSASPFVATPTPCSANRKLHRCGRCRMRRRPTRSSH